MKPCPDTHIQQFDSISTPKQRNPPNLCTRVVDTAILQHPPNPLQHSLSAFWQNRPERRKVGDTLTATVEPDDAVVTYQWLANGEDIIGEDDATLFISEDYIGSKISVEVTDEDGNTAVSDETKKVSAPDHSKDVTIVDDYGLQSDGTAAIGDRLSLAYGSDFGSPKAITWYFNEKVDTATTTEGGELGGLVHVADPANGPGVYYAVVTDAQGNSYKTTNSITVSSKEDAAVIESFTIEDDYTDGTDILFATKDTKAIVTVTLAKNYQGRFRVYAASDTHYATPLGNDIMTTSIAAAKNTAAQQVMIAGTDGAAVLCTTMPTKKNVLEATTKGAGFGFISSDGSVTYMWQLDTTGVTRGTKYVLTFDQASVTTDTPGGGTANVTEEVEAPYVVAPSDYAITSIANGSQAKITFYDEDGAVAYWMNDPANTLASIGLASADVYGNKSDSVKDGTKLANGGAIKTTKGVLTTAYYGSTSYAYNYAEMKTTAGIFGANATTWITDTALLAQDAADSVTILQKKASPNTATVKFSNLRTSGTLYITSGIKTGETTTARIFAGFDPANSSTYEAKVTVAAGTSELDVDNAIQAINGTAGKNLYLAIFIPDDTDNFGMIYTNDSEDSTGATSAVNWTAATNATAGVKGCPLYVKAQLATFSLGGSAKEFLDGAASATTGAPAANEKYLIAKDQFGNAMDFDATMTTAAAALTDITPTAQGYEAITATLTTTVSTGNSVAESKKVGLIQLDESASTAGKTANIKKYTIALTTGQTLTATISTPGAQGAAKWTISIS